MASLRAQSAEENWEVPELDYTYIDITKGTTPTFFLVPYNPNRDSRGRCVILENADIALVPESEGANPKLYSARKWSRNAARTPSDAEADTLIEQELPVLPTQIMTPATIFRPSNSDKLPRLLRFRFISPKRFLLLVKLFHLD